MTTISEKDTLMTDFLKTGGIQSVQPSGSLKERLIADFLKTKKIQFVKLPAKPNTVEGTTIFSVLNSLKPTVLPEDTDTVNKSTK